MMMRMILSSLIFSSNAFAQMAAPSFFKDMKAVNPAIITMRKEANVRMRGQVDDVKKTQKATSDDSSFVANEVSKTRLENVNFFKGSRGGGFTTELVLDHTAGQKKSDLVDSSNNTSGYTTNARSSYLNFSVGSPGKIGLSGIYVNYKSDYKYTGKYNGQSYSNSYSNKTSVIGARGGVVYGGPLSLGFIAEYDRFSVFRDGKPGKEIILGMAFAATGSKYHFEFGVELDPFTKQDQDPTGRESPMPMKFSLLAEVKYDKITFGYKGRAFRGRYQDLDRIIQSQMLFNEIGQEIRLEHSFNFSLGGSRGLGFGGSASFSKSKTQEASAVFSTAKKSDTDTRAASMALEVSYSY